MSPNGMRAQPDKFKQTFVCCELEVALNIAIANYEDGE